MIRLSSNGELISENAAQIWTIVKIQNQSSVIPVDVLPIVMFAERYYTDMLMNPFPYMSIDCPWDASQLEYSARSAAGMFTSSLSVSIAKSSRTLVFENAMPELKNPKIR